MDNKDKVSPWNSLEISKFLVSILTPLTVAFVGFSLNSSLEEQKQFYKLQERLADNRLNIYNEIKYKLNRIYCFIEDIGTWKEETPKKIISYKRSIDQSMHSQRAIWSRDTFDAYLKYMDSAFEPYQGVGLDAKIKTSKIQKESIKEWTNEWNNNIKDKKDNNHKSSYENLINLISRDLMLIQIQKSK